jgi:hypothetical protein
MHKHLISMKDVDLLLDDGFCASFGLCFAVLACVCSLICMQ